MALGFVKRMFSFGRTKEEEKPAEAAALPDTLAPLAPTEEPAAPKAIPTAESVAAVTLIRREPVEAPVIDGAPAFTPETLPTEATAEPVETPEPIVETIETAGEVSLDPDTAEPEESAALPSLADESTATHDGIDTDPAPLPTVEGGIRISRGSAPSTELTDIAPPQKLSWFQRLRQGLSRTSAQLTDQITSIFTKRKLDEDTLQDLEDVLIRADLGIETAMRVTDTLASGRYGKSVDSADVAKIMASEIEKVLAPVARSLELNLDHKPHVILVVGVNGTGKTTTIGKLASKLTRGGLKVTLAAGDTFRAAAIEQLKIWGERTGATVISSKLGADAAGLAYDAFEKAKANGSDVVIVDTAGRLQNKAELMAELEKVVRVLGKLDPDAPHTVLQTLDATTGQNALNQVEIFRNVAGVNGLVMTKLDGSARGGILVAIAAKHKLPVYFIGVGEGIDDLEPFEAREFAAAIAGTPLK
ncbi:signal recognition particle-docking protein FtsY [Georhizobium profundi]|uniref:Signal recognition particle receptor FtsY n=1 Tax=Georhizobium profundi TaxID=2341112 RepID=A0A3Q8XNL7_9HYPH|nr:signal recognition particle-docking protein FtsY [Georhizobium profundi]AZN70406.1 signal recognition particle-docking protein FtsY [Georhizobium profundi]